MTTSANPFRTPSFARALPAAALIVAASFVGAPGCASGPATSGFLGDTSEFAPRPDEPDSLVWRAADADLVAYDRLMIDPVEVGLVPGAAAEGTDPATLESLAAALREALVATVDPYYPVLDAPAPRTLRLRISLADVERAAAGAASGSDAADVLASRVEFEVLDAETGRRLAAGTRRRESPGRSGFQPWADLLLDFMNSPRGEVR